jgi:hypothetical protein
MQDVQPPLPSTRALLLSVGVAALLAALVLVTLVLPAEYGIDPSGIGAAIGLTRLSQSEDPTDILENPDPAETGGLREDTAMIEIDPGTELEYKLRIGAGSLLEYEWKTDGGILFAELHGEPADDRSGYYEDFAVGHATDLKGSLEPPFEGTHGWFWKNENSVRVTVTLTTRGVYEIVGKR